LVWQRTGTAGGCRMGDCGLNLSGRGQGQLGAVVNKSSGSTKCREFVE
jgi:hypothetical protein